MQPNCSRKGLDKFTHFLGGCESPCCPTFLSALRIVLPIQWDSNYVSFYFTFSWLPISMSIYSYIFNHLKIIFCNLPIYIFTHVSMGLFALFLLICRSWFYILGINLSLILCRSKIFLSVFSLYNCYCFCCCRKTMF